MSRCIYCDYSEDGGHSEFFLGLHDSGRLRGRTLVWDDAEQGYVCTTCRSESIEYEDTFLDEDEDDEPTD